MRSSQSIILLYQQDLQQLIPTMSSPASHLNSSDSNEDQIYNVDSTLQSRMPNEGLPLATFYGTKNLPSSDSPSKNIRARRHDFGKHSPDSDLSSVDSPIDDSDDDHHWEPKDKGSSSDDNEEPACIAPKKSDVPQVQQTMKRGALLVLRTKILRTKTQVPLERVFVKKETSGYIIDINTDSYFITGINLKGPILAFDGTSISINIDDYLASSITTTTSS